MHRSGGEASRSFDFAQDDGLSDRMSFAGRCWEYRAKRFALTVSMVVAYSPRAERGFCFCDLKRFRNTPYVCTDRLRS